MTRKQVLGSVLGSLLAAAALAGCMTMGETQRVEAGGARVSFATAGDGAPTVVFESGLGDGMSTWSDVFAEVAEVTSVFAYDRPGYGPGFAARFDSDDDGRRTGPEIAEHLHAVLEDADIPKPYILVGHSIGGLYALHFAAAFPEDVAGFVLVDGRPPAFTAACRAADAGLCELPGWMTVTMPAHQRAEVRGAAETERTAPQPEALGATPLTVITATEPAALSSRRFQDLWIEQQRAYADGAANARYVEATGASHYVHHQRRALVVKEITRMVRAAQES